jgi:hypothetical protein
VFSGNLLCVRSSTVLCVGRGPDIYCERLSLLCPATPIPSLGAQLCVVFRALLHGVSGAPYCVTGVSNRWRQRHCFVMSEALIFVFRGPYFVLSETLYFMVSGPKEPYFVLSRAPFCVARGPTLLYQKPSFVLSGALLCFVLSGAPTCVVRGPNLWR